MKRVLKRLGHFDSNGVIQTKGRTACEVNTADELVVVELIFAGIFNDLSVEEDSDFIFQGEFSDIEFQKESPTAGTLFFEVKTLIAPGTGYILFTEAPEFLPLGEWQLGEILRPLGSDWKLIEVPDNSSSTPLS